MSNETKSEESPIREENGEPDPPAAPSNADSALPDAEEIADRDSDFGQLATAPPRPKSARWVAWLALILALAAVGLLGYASLSDRQASRLAAETDQGLAALIGRLQSQSESTGSAVGELRETVAALEAENKRLTAAIEGFNLQLDERSGLIDTVAPRLSSVEKSISNLQGISSGARDTWLSAEAEYYLQIANVQLQLAGNPGLAILALEMADERIAQLSDPALIEVRQALADELAALEAMEKPDIEGTTLTLASLARVAESLPMRRIEIAVSPDDQPAGPEATGMDRALASVKGAFSGLVKVIPPDAAVLPLVSPETEALLRANLGLQLQSARLALLRAERAAFEQGLDDALASLDTHFDQQSTQVTSAQETIREIRAGDYAIEPPDISGSLRLLRQYQALAETTP